MLIRLSVWVRVKQKKQQRRWIFWEKKVNRMWMIFVVKTPTVADSTQRGIPHEWVYVCMKRCEVDSPRTRTCSVFLPYLQAWGGGVLVTCSRWLWLHRITLLFQPLQTELPPPLPPAAAAAAAATAAGPECIYSLSPLCLCSSEHC